MIVVSGPIAQSSPIVVPPLRHVPGSITVSRPIVTLDVDVRAMSGSMIVTPLRAWRSWMRFWASLRTCASSTRSLTPSVSVWSVTRCAAIVLPGSRSFGSDVGQVELALRVVACRSGRSAVEQARAVERVDARVDLADRELLRRRVPLGLGLDDLLDVALARRG